LIVGFLTFPCDAKLLFLFHLIGICISLHLCFKNSNIFAWGIPQLPPCFSLHAWTHFSTPSSHWRMWPCWVLNLNGWIHWNSFHAMKNIIFGCARISATYSCQYFFLSHGILTTTHITHHLPYVYIVQLRQLKTQQIIYKKKKAIYFNNLWIKMKP
jgi:hypothetical protein